MQSYLKLINEFPLRPLRTEKDLDAAIVMCDKLIDRKKKLNQEEEDYLDVLGDLIWAYEKEKHPIPKLKPAETLRYLLEENDLTQCQLSKETGIPESTISEILREKRGISRKMCLKLASRFKVSAELFI